MLYQNSHDNNAGKMTFCCMFNLALNRRQMQEHSTFCSSELKARSLIHYEVLYSAPSRLLLRSAPDPSTAEKDSFEASIERFRVDSGM